MRAVVADVLLGLPLFKHLFQAMGCVSAGNIFTPNLVSHVHVFRRIGHRNFAISNSFYNQIALCCKGQGMHAEGG
jgi:hypothetical protein